MPKKRPTEIGWDSDEDMLLEDTGTISLFTKKFGNEEEIIDEDALLGIEDDGSKMAQKSNLTGEGFELFVDDKEMGFDDTTESQELDYEDTGYQEEEVVQEYPDTEPSGLLVVSQTPNQTVTQIHPIKAEVFGAKTGESDNSDSDEEKKLRGRFKTERQTITLKTPLFTKAAAIPDSLEVTKEMQEEIDSFNQQQGKRGKQRNNRNNRKNFPQQQQQQRFQQQMGNPQQQQHFQNNIQPVRPIRHQQQFQRQHRPHGNNQRHNGPRQGGPRFNGPRLFTPRGPQQNFNPQRPIEPVHRGNFRPPIRPHQERGPVPVFAHEAMEIQRNAHSSPGPQPHPPPLLYEQSLQQHPQPPHQPVSFNHGHPQQGPGAPQSPFSPPPPAHSQHQAPFSPPPPAHSQHQAPAVHVNPNFQGQIPQEAFSYPQQQQSQSYQPQQQTPQPPYPTSSQPVQSPQHFQQPGLPPHSVHHPQHQQPQHFQQHQQGYPPQHRHNFPPHQGPPQRPPHGPPHGSPHGPPQRPAQGPPEQRPPQGPQGPRHALLESPGPRPGFQQRPGPPNNRPGQPRPLFQTGPRPLVPQQHQQQMMRGPPPPRPNHQHPPQRAPNPVGQQIPQRFQGQNQTPQRHPNLQGTPQRFQTPNPGPRGPGPIQPSGAFNPTPDQFVPLLTDEERRQQEEEQLRKMRDMEEKKRKRAERFSKNEPVEVATTSGNLKVIKTTTRLGQKRTSTSNITEISPAKIIKMEFNHQPMEMGPDGDLQAKLEKQKMIREKIQRQKEARRQAEAENRRQKLSEKMALEGTSIEDLDKEQKQAFAIKRIQDQLKVQQEHYKALKQQQQQNPNNLNRQQSAGLQLEKGHQAGQGRGHMIQGQQNVGRGQQGIGRGQSNQNVGRGNMIQGQKSVGRGRGKGMGVQVMQGKQQGDNGTNLQPGNRTVIAQGSKFNRMNSMGAASQSQPGGRIVANVKEESKRTVLPEGTQQGRRIVLESAKPSTVSIEGLSLKPDLGKIQGLCTSVGIVENFNYRIEERRVLVRFADQGQANKFVTKYNRYMLDLTHIKVRHVSNIS